MFKKIVPALTIVVGLSLTIGITSAQAFTADTWTKKFIDRDFKTSLKESRRDDSKSALSIRGWSYFMLDDYGSALAVFREMEKEYPRNFDVRLGIAWCSIKMGRYDLAQEYLEKADDSKNGWQRYMVYDARGWLAMNKGDFETAHDEFSMEDRVYHRFQDPMPDYSVSMGWLAARQGDWETAKNKFEGGIRREKNCYFCRDGLARAALIEQNYEEALTQSLAGLKINDDNGGLQGLLAGSLAGLNDLDRSPKIYQSLIEKNPDNPAFHASLGYVLLGKGKVNLAERKFREALELQPGHLVAQAGIGALQYNKTKLVAEGWQAYYAGDYKMALNIFTDRSAEALSKQNPSAEDGRGWVLLALDRPQEARDAFQKALKIDSEFFFSYSGRVAAERMLLVTYNQAWALTNLGRFDEALETFTRARSDTPVDMQWLIEDGLAWISYYQGDLDKAKAAFSSIVASNDNAYLSKTGLGMVALKNADYQAAASYITASLVQNPYQALATYIKPAKTFVDEGQFEQAQKILQLAEKIYPYSADVQFMYAQAAFALKDDNTAAKKINAAAYLAPTYIAPVFDDIGVSKTLVKDGLLSLGWGLYYGGQSQKAVDRFDQYEEAGGTAISADTGRGWALLALQKYDAAKESFAKANDQKENADAHAGIGWARLGKDDTSGAEKSFKAAQKIIPGYIAAQSGFVNIQFRKMALVKDGWDAYYKGQFDDALTAFEAKRSEARNDDNPSAEDGRGWTLLAQGKNKEAKKAFDAALKIDANFFYSQSGRIAAERAALNLYNIAWAQSEAGLFDKATATFEKARTEAKPEFKWLIDDGLAWIDFYKKDYAAAKQSFQAVLDNEPKAYLSTKGLGFVALKNGDYDEAVKKVAESVLLNPYQTISTYTLPSEDLIKAGKFKLAKELLDLGFKVYPRSADINFQMAKVFVGLKDQETATLW
ncbi:MAG: tetratricopeptide repeat protein, partial [Magnetovibrio sp.]|nr:tetratricopeptide repeat protein [Magnetovibrio sp.]